MMVATTTFQIDFMGMVSKWFRKGSERVPNRFRTGSEQVPIRIGSARVPKRFRTGSELSEGLRSEPFRNLVGTRSEPSANPLLEVELQHQFHDPCGAHGARDLAEVVRRVEVARRRTKARRVRQVERLGAELEVPFAAGAELLRERRVDVDVPGRTGDA